MSDSKRPDSNRPYEWGPQPIKLPSPVPRLAPGGKTPTGEIDIRELAASEKKRKKRRPFIYGGGASALCGSLFAAWLSFDESRDSKKQSKSTSESVVVMQARQDERLKSQGKEIDETKTEVKAHDKLIHKLERASDRHDDEHKLMMDALGVPQWKRPKKKPEDE